MSFMCSKKWYDHISSIVIEYAEDFNQYLSGNGDPDIAYHLSYIDERKGSPFAAMSNLQRRVYAAGAHALWAERDLPKFKRYAYQLGKLEILSSMDWDYPEPFFLCAETPNVANPLFVMLMSDSPKIRSFLLRNIDLISNDTEEFADRYDLNRQLKYNTLLMLEGTQLERLERRSLNVLENQQQSKWLQLRCEDFLFFLAFARQDPAAMRQALDPLFEKKRARQAAKETLSYFDFFLQPQIVMYAKIAAIHGFDLGIDHEIAPKEAIAYAPLPEGEYQDPFDFMRAYDLDFPYEYLQNWVDYYTGQTDTLGLPPLVNDE